MKGYATIQVRHLLLYCVSILNGWIFFSKLCLYAVGGCTCLYLMSVSYDCRTLIHTSRRFLAFSRYSDI